MVENLGIAELLINSFEPKRQNTWYLEIDGLDAWTMRTAARPNWSHDETLIEYLNIKRYFAGKVTYSPITIALNDPIAPSAAQKVLEWARLCHEANTGRSGYAQMYKKDITLKMLGPIGDLVESWTLHGAWVQSIDFGGLDYASSEVATCTLVIRFDWPSLDF